MGAIIKCCINCVAPKRHPGCHDHCSEYLEQRALYDELKAVDDEKNRIAAGIKSQRDKRVMAALRKGRK